MRNKNVAVIGASTGMFGAVWAQAEARKVLASAGARVLDRELAVPLAADQFDEAGDLVDLGLANSLGELVTALARSDRSQPQRRSSSCAGFDERNASLA